MTVLEMEGVSYSYNGSAVFREVHIRIEQGDFVAVIGPNGSGKTTLVKIALGLLRPGNGKVRLFGKDIASFGDWSLVGYIPQKGEFDRNFPGSVREVLALKGGQESPDITRMLGLEKLLERKVSELSGGQQQKVLIALSMTSKPKLLILDEPTVGVDVDALQKFYAMLKRLNRELGVTIVLVTHEVGMIQNYVKSVFCISREFSCRGSPDEMDAMLKKAYGSGFGIHHHR